MKALDARDRALAMRLVMGCVAATGELDRVLDVHLNKGTRLEPRLGDALRLAAFEILYLHTPSAVAVSQGVELARSVAPRAAGLANAVLRRVVSYDLPELNQARARLTEGTYSPADLARVGGLPEWLADQALESLGRTAASRWAEHALAPAEAWVAANRARHDLEVTQEKLLAAGCEPLVGPIPGSFLLGCPSALHSSDLVSSVDVLPVDIAAQDVVFRLPVMPGSRILEVGQGRGTKTILIEGAAISAGAPVEIVSVEVNEDLSELAMRRMVTAGISKHVHCLALDGRDLKNRDDLATFDLVFVDAPCTGTGTLARHPEIAWSLKRTAPKDLAALQLDLLAAASSRVASGGTLAYSTCSVLKEENENVVDAFLATESGLTFVLAWASRTNLDSADTHFLALLTKA